MKKAQCSSVVKHLPTMHETLGSIFSSTEKEEEEEEEEKKTKTKKKR
jgi:hypothetical protein